jgi:hypothetical protein
VRGKPLAAQVAPMPFVVHRYKRAHDTPKLGGV